jgi:hypothetical protein
VAVDGFYGGYMQVRASGPSIDIREGDKHTLLAQGDRVGIHDVVTVSASMPDSKRLEGLTA